MTLSRSIHVAANGIISLFFNDWVIFHCIYVCPTSSLSIGHRWVFINKLLPCLDYCNSAEMNIEVHVYFWINFFSEYMLRSGTSGSHGSSIFSFYLFLTSLCLCCCVWAFSSCGKWGLLLVVVWELLIAVASLVAEATLGPTSFSSCCWAQYLWPIGLAAPKHVESCWTRDGTHVPCIGWCILHHWAIKEVHGLALEIIHNYFHPILFIRRGFLRLTHTQGKGRFW